MRQTSTSMNMKRSHCLGIGLLRSISVSVAAEPAKPLALHARSRLETAQGSGEWQVAEKVQHWDPKKTAIVICDMWDQHWCKGATTRVAEMAPRMNQVVKE